MPLGCHPTSNIVKISALRFPTAPTNTPRFIQMSSVTESAKFFQAILFSDEQDLCPHPLTHQEQLGDSTGATALEVNVGYNQEWPAFNRGDEASRPRYFDDFHATITVFPVGVHLGPQSNLPPYEASFYQAFRGPGVCSYIPDSTGRAGNYSKCKELQQTSPHDPPQGSPYLYKLQ